MSSINHFDLAFIVDTTGSMGSLIQAAQNQMVSMVDQLSKESEIDVQFGVIEYRDHPPQDQMIFKAYNLTSDLKKIRKAIQGLKASGGGDAPEAVFAGIVAAIRELTWRPHARRMAVLVGDAPPHGVGANGDGFPNGCPSGEDIQSVAAKSEENRMTLYSLGLNRSCEPHFEKISRLTGGRYFRSEDAKAAMSQIKEILTREFGDLEFDREVHDAWDLSVDPSVDEVAEQLNSTPSKVGSALCRLQSRGLLAAGQSKI